MVRTYAFNASMQSHQREHQKNAFINDYNNIQRKTKPSYHHTNSNVFDPPSPVAKKSIDYTSSHQPPITNPTDLQYSPFHSPLIDPIGSIVGLRLLHINGKLAYVPVEPQINMLINQQFGNMNRPNLDDIFTPNDVLKDNIANNNVGSQNRGASYYNPQHAQRPMSYENYSVNDYSRRDSSVYGKQNNDHNNMVAAKSYGSLPNLAHRQPLSSQEQHKLELQMQIEDNKRRKEMERQKELELEQREIRKWEEYREKVRREEELEKEKQREKAIAMERRSRQIYEEQADQQRRARQKAPPRQNSHQYRNDFHPDYPPNDYENRPPSKPIRSRMSSMEKAPEPRPDSAQPREIEWWEKKPSWQEQERQSAVIPTLRGKPPARPPSSAGSRRGYDKSELEQNSSHTSRAATPEEHNNRRNYKKPTAFTITA